MGLYVTQTFYCDGPIYYENDDETTCDEKLVYAGNDTIEAVEFARKLDWYIKENKNLYPVEVLCPKHNKGK